MNRELQYFSLDIRKCFNHKLFYKNSDAIGIQMMQINFLKVYTVRFEAAD